MMLLPFSTAFMRSFQVFHWKSSLAMCAIVAYISDVPTITKESKSSRFVARVTAADKQLFQKAATLEGRSMAKFVVVHAREVAQKIISQSEQIQLNGEQSRRFVETLLTPSRPVPPSLAKAAKQSRRTVISDLD